MKNILRLAVAATLPIVMFTACTDRPSTETIKNNVNTSQVDKPNIISVETEKTYETALIAGVKFTVKTTPSGCTLMAENDRTFELDLEENCKFHRLENSEIQIENGHHGPTFLIMSVRQNKENEGCSHRIATITVVNKKTYIDPVVSRGAACWGQFPLDDIYFLAPRFDGLPYPGD